MSRTKTCKAIKCLATLAIGHADKVKLAYIFLYSLPGSPCLLYGLEGDNDTRSRQCMTSMNSPIDMPYFEHIKRCIELRKKYLAIGSIGQIEFIYNQNQALIYRKYHEDESVYYYINNHSEEIILPVVDEFQNEVVCDIYQDESLAVKTQLKLSPFNFMI